MQIVQHNWLWKVLSLVLAFSLYAFVSKEEAPTQRLRLTGPSGPLAYASSGGGKRVVRLGSGEFVGGSFPDLTLKMAVAGRYTASWAAAVSWNGRSVILPAAPVFIDRR